MYDGLRFPKLYWDNPVTLIYKNVSSLIFLNQYNWTNISWVFMTSNIFFAHVVKYVEIQYLRMWHDSQDFIGQEFLTWLLTRITWEIFKNADDQASP